MFCSNCGNKIMEGARFCSNCGTKVAMDVAMDLGASEPVKEDAPKIQPESRRDSFEFPEHKNDKIEEPSNSFDFDINWERTDDEAPAKSAFENRVSFDWSSVIDESHKKVVPEIKSPWDIDEPAGDISFLGTASDSEASDLEKSIFEENKNPSTDRGRTMTFIDILKKERADKERAAAEAAQAMTEPGEEPYDYSAFDDVQNLGVASYDEEPSSDFKIEPPRSFDSRRFEHEEDTAFDSMFGTHEAPTSETSASAIDEFEEYRKLRRESNEQNANDFQQDEPINVVTPAADEEAEIKSAYEASVDAEKAASDKLEAELAAILGTGIAKTDDETEAPDIFDAVDTADAVYADDEEPESIEDMYLDGDDEEIELEPFNSPEIDAEAIFADLIDDVTDSSKDKLANVDRITMEDIFEPEELEAAEAATEPEEEKKSILDKPAEAVAAVAAAVSDPQAEIDALRKRLAELLAEKEEEIEIEPATLDIADLEEGPETLDIEDLVEETEEYDDTEIPDLDEDSDEDETSETMMEDAVTEAEEVEEAQEEEPAVEEPSEFNIDEELAKLGFMPEDDDLEEEEEEAAWEEPQAEAAYEAEEIEEIEETEEAEDVEEPEATAEAPETPETAETAEEMEEVVVEAAEVEIDEPEASEEIAADDADDESLLDALLEEFDEPDEAPEEPNTVDSLETDAMSIDELEKDLFGESFDEDNEAEATRKIDKFYTLYRKNEEFQKLLDDEYNRLQINVDDEPESELSDNTIVQMEDEFSKAVQSHSLDADNEMTEYTPGDYAPKVAEPEEPAKDIYVKPAEAETTDKTANPLPESVESEADLFEPKMEQEEGGAALTVIAVIIAVILVLLLAAILILNFAPSSSIGIKLDSMVQTIACMVTSTDAGTGLLL